MTSRFFARVFFGGSESEDDSDYEEEVQEVQDNDVNNRYLQSGSDDDDELDSKRVVKPAKDKRFEDLKEVVAANKEDRMRKAMEAQAIITEEAKHFEAWRDSLETVPTIKKLRGYTERIIAAEIEKSLPKLGVEITNKKMKKTVDDLIRGIVNKLLHGPMQHLRCDGSDSRTLSETLENMQALNIGCMDLMLRYLRRRLELRWSKSSEIERVFVASFF